MHQRHRPSPNEDVQSRSRMRRLGLGSPPLLLAMAMALALTAAPSRHGALALSSPSPFEGARAFTHFHVTTTTAADSAGNAVLKTGTTIAGVVVDGAVILAADTRSTMGKVVADKNCEKIHKLSDSMFCCGAGTAADAEQLTGAVRQWLKLERAKGFMSLADQDAPPAPRVVAAASALGRLLFRGGGGDKGGPSAAFVLGGVDATGARLLQIESDGSMQPVRYTAMGSGFAAAMAVLEAQHRPNMTIADGVALLHDAITSGILNDMGSGSHVDLCIIHAPTGAVEYRRDVRRRSPLLPSPSPLPTTTPAPADDGDSSSSSNQRPLPATTPSSPSSFLHPRGALAAAAGPKAALADIHRLVGGRVGKGEVRHEPLRPFRQRELRFHGSPTAGQKESTGGEETAAAAAALAAASGDVGEGGKRGGMAGFELRFSSSPDEDVEVL